MLHLRRTRASATYQIRNITQIPVLLTILIGLCYATKRKMSDTETSLDPITKTSRDDIDNTCYICHDTLDLTIEAYNPSNSMVETFEFNILKCGSSECHCNFHLPCFINRLYKRRKCPNCKVGIKYPRLAIF